MRIMFIHVPAATWLSMFVYVCLAVASFLALVFRHVLADAAAAGRRAAGRRLTLLALVTGSLWGRPMWGTWWVWDARLTSVLVLFLFYMAYIALRASLDDEAKAARAVGDPGAGGRGEPADHPLERDLVEQPAPGHARCSPRAAGHAGLRQAALLMCWPILAAFGSLWLVRIRGEVWRRRAEAAALRAARA